MKQLRITLVVLSLLIAASSNHTLSDQRLFGRNGGETCPTWFVPKRSDDNGTVCRCGNLFGYSVQCREQTNQSLLEAEHCMTFDIATNTTFLSKCPFNSLRETNSDYTLLPQNVSKLNKFMCGGLNRTGLLCGQCSPGFGPAVLTYDMKCVKCLDSAYGWLLYTLIALGPTTVIFLIVLFLQMRATSAPMNAFVFMCHFVIVSVTGNKSEIFEHHISPVNFCFFIIISFYGIWSLDFFRLVIPPFCISDNHSILLVLSLEYVGAVYPLFLVVISYVCIQLHSRGCKVLVCLCIPFKSCFARLERRGFDPSQSLVHAFTTFLLLSYAKFLYISLNLLRYTELHSSIVRSIGPPVLYYNASVPYLGDEHIPFAILAVLMLTIFSVFPLLVVVLYPTRFFQKCLNCCRIRWHAVHAFADAFNGCYKNGTNGTYDYRYFAGLYLLLRILFLTSWYNPWVIGGLLNVMWPFIASLMFALMRPYKENWFNMLDSLQLVLLGFVLLVTMYVEDALLLVPKRFFGVVAIIPLLYFIAYIICKLTLCTSVLDRCDCHRLKVVMQQVTGTYNITPAHPRCYDEEDVPHRLLYPSEYNEVQIDSDQADSEDDPIQEIVPTYGAIV